MRNIHWKFQVLLDKKILKKLSYKLKGKKKKIVLNKLSVSTISFEFRAQIYIVFVFFEKLSTFCTIRFYFLLKTFFF